MVVSLHSVAARNHQCTWCVMSGAVWKTRLAADDAELVINYRIPPSPAAVEKVYMRCVPYENLRQATNDFSNKCLSQGGYKIGQGGFGDVFFVKISVKGRPKLECAVKRLTGDYSQSEATKQFEAEVETMKMWVSICFIVVLLP